MKQCNTKQCKRTNTIQQKTTKKKKKKEKKREKKKEGINVSLRNGIPRRANGAEHVAVEYGPLKFGII